MAFVTKLKKHFVKFKQGLEVIKEGEELSIGQEWSETDELFDDEYELIKEEHLSQVLCNDRLEILRKQGHSESDIDEICSQGNSWYTQMTIPIFENKVPPSLMDNRDSLRKQVCVWSAQKHGLSQSQEKLNKKLLSIVKYLDWCDESALFDYDNGSVYELEKFLEDNKSNPDLKVVLNLQRGESGATILHAVLGARVGHNQENRALGLLLAAGADPNAKDNEGETPLHYATAIGNDKGVSSLLWKNANPNIRNRQGKTPQQIAIDSGHYSVAGLLLTKEQEELRRELYNILIIPIFGHIRFTKTLKEFLDKHKSNPDLKVVLNIRGERDELEVLELARHITYFDKATGAEIRELFLNAGASCDVLYSIAKEERPLVLWNRLTPGQQKKLDDFLDMVSKAEDMNELEKVIDEAIRSGVWINFNKDFSPEDPTICNWCSFTDYVIKRIGELKKNPKVASDVICKLVSRGAVFYTKNSMDVMGKLELEFKDHKANIKKAHADYINNAHKFIKIAKSASNGMVKNAKMDNSSFYLEYSEDSTIDVAKITDGARNLGLAQKETGYGRDVIKIGKSEVEIITASSIRHYTDLTDGSDIVLIFYTSLGELEVRLYPDMQNKNLIRVEVRDQEMWEKLKHCNEELGKNCSLGGYSVCDAIEQRYFERLEKPHQSSEKITLLNKQKKGNWCERISMVPRSEQTTGRSVG